MNHITKAFRVTYKLTELMALMKRLHGDRWPQVSGPIREQLIAIMAARGETNPLALALPAAQAMEKDGEDPLLMLAVAADLCENKPSVGQALTP